MGKEISSSSVAFALLKPTNAKHLETYQFGPTTGWLFIFVETRRAFGHRNSPHQPRQLSHTAPPDG